MHDSCLQCLHQGLTIALLVGPVLWFLVPKNPGSLVVVLCFSPWFNGSWTCILNCMVISALVLRSDLHVVWKPAPTLCSVVQWVLHTFTQRWPLFAFQSGAACTKAGCKGEEETSSKTFQRLNEKCEAKEIRWHRYVLLCEQRFTCEWKREGVECLDSASQITPHKHSHTWTKLLWFLLALFCFVFVLSSCFSTAPAGKNCCGVTAQARAWA